MKTRTMIALVLLAWLAGCAEPRPPRADRPDGAVLAAPGASSKLLATKALSRMTPDELLVFSVKAGDLAHLEQALSAGADPQSVNEHGVPVLISAVLYTQVIGRLPILEALLSHGADVRLEYEGKTALVFAAEIGSPEAIDRLLASRAELNFRGAETALTAAVKRGHARTVEYLLQKGAAPGLANRAGQLPRDLAAQHGLTGLVALLDSRVSP